MLNKALDKIEAELEKNIDNRNLIVIGDYLVNLCKKSPSAAEKIADESKSMIGALKYMIKHVEKQASRENNCIAVPDGEGFEVVCEYYGIGDIEETHKESETKVVSIFDMF